jgi:hypothetical protein
MQMQAYIAASMGGAGLLLVLPLLVLGRPQPGAPWDAVRVIVMIAACIASIGWAMFFAVKAYSLQDEYQRERSKDAWYWGGSVGAMVAGPLIAFVALGGLDWARAGLTASLRPTQAFLYGALVPILCMLGGFIVARALPRRPSMN